MQANVDVFLVHYCGIWHGTDVRTWWIYGGNEALKKSQFTLLRHSSKNTYRQKYRFQSTDASEQSEML